MEMADINNSAAQMGMRVVPVSQAEFEIANDRSFEAFAAIFGVVRPSPKAFLQVRPDVSSGLFKSLVAQILTQWLPRLESLADDEGTVAGPLDLECSLDH